MTTGADPNPLSPTRNVGSKGDNVNADFPEWAGRQLLAEALRAVGLPVMFGAMYRRPRDTMTMRQRLQAIEVVGRVLDEARRRLPPGVSGAVLLGEWREAAWRCTVAGLALLDEQAREQLTGKAEPEPELPAVQAEPAVVAVAESVAEPEPVVIRRRVAEAPAVKPAVSVLFRRRGEVARAS